jgi:hypothetical protein
MNLIWFFFVSITILCVDVFIWDATRKEENYFIRNDRERVKRKYASNQLFARDAGWRVCRIKLMLKFSVLFKKNFYLLFFSIQKITPFFHSFFFKYFKIFLSKILKVHQPLPRSPLISFRYLFIKSLKKIFQH